MLYRLLYQQPIKAKYAHCRNIIMAVLMIISAGQISALASDGADRLAAGQDPDHGRPKGSAWTLTTPLGLREHAEIDTLLYNFQRHAIPSMATDAYATTGNAGAPGIDMLYFGRKAPTTFFFNDALSRWLPSVYNQKLYNVYSPMTLVGYDFAGGSQNHTDLFSVQFAANANRKVGVSAFFDFDYSKGCYDAQAVKNIFWGLGAYYYGNRYEMQTVFNMHNALGKENGGITDDRFITDPAQMQGGVNSIEPKTIPVNLSAAHSRLSGAQLLSTHALKVGYWDTEQVNDTLTRDIYIPAIRFLYTLKATGNKHYFINTNSTQGEKFWTNHYFSTSRTADDTRYWSLENTVGMEMLEGFKKWVKFGLSAYATLETRQFMLPSLYYGAIDKDNTALTPLPAGLDIAAKTTQNILWVGGRLDKRNGEIIRYAADARFGMAGDALGDIDLKGEISSRFKLLGDTVQIEGHGRLSNLETSWLLRNYISNHFAWQNNFGKVRSARFGGSMLIPWTGTTIAADFDNTQNLVYFSSAGLPTQYGGNVQVFAARLEQDLHFGIWNWRNRLTYQTTSNSDVLPLPTLAAYSNMYLGFKIVNTLDLQIGVDADWYSRYRGLSYQPATMAFCVQSADGLDVGNFILANAYVTAKIQKVRFYIMWSHFNAGLGKAAYFSMPHYPVDPSRVQFGLSIDFPD